MKSKKGFITVEMFIVIIIVLMLAILGSCVAFVVVGGKKAVEHVSEHGIKGIAERVYYGDTNKLETVPYESKDEFKNY